MKGPYERLKYDLRRLWECPACKRRERTDGTVTFRFCTCGTKQPGGQPVVMHLIADGAQRLVPPIAAARGQCRDDPAGDPPPARSASEEVSAGGESSEPAPAHHASGEVAASDVADRDTTVDASTAGTGSSSG